VYSCTGVLLYTAQAIDNCVYRCTVIYNTGIYVYSCTLIYSTDNRESCVELYWRPVIYSIGNSELCAQL